MKYRCVVMAMIALLAGAAAAWEQAECDRAIGNIALEARSCQQQSANAGRELSGELKTGDPTCSEVRRPFRSLVFSQAHLPSAARAGGSAVRGGRLAPSGLLLPSACGRRLALSCSYLSLTPDVVVLSCRCRRRCSWRSTACSPSVTARGTGRTTSPR